jgi:tRNA-splicing ligase RtcB
MLCGKDIHIFGRELINNNAVNQLIACMIPDWALQGAAMPDMHYGFTMPIGGVIKTNGVVVPTWVGFDIGCGVCYVETTFQAGDLQLFKHDIYDQVKAAIPSGFKHQSTAKFKMPVHSMSTSMWFQDNYYDRGGDKQLGTLGSGNHFIEIGVNNADKVCFVIHSGSRGIGHDTATHYIKMAHPEGKCGGRKGSYELDLITKAGSDYISDMNACLDFAHANRTVMLEDVCLTMKGMGLEGTMKWDTLINKTHNHAEVTENGHVIHRKGATDSGLDVPGVIPGQSKVGSFIVRGRGDSDALCSSSHGIGRTGSRTEAKATLSLEKFADDMDGIVAHVGPETLDEAPEAYKDPDLVMAAQKDLVEVIDHVVPVVCIKDTTKRNRRGKNTNAKK